MSVPSSLALCSHLRAAACGILNCAHMLTLRRGFLPLGRLVGGTVDIVQKAIGDDDKTNFLPSHFIWILNKAKALTRPHFATDNKFAIAFYPTSILLTHLAGQDNLL